MKLLCGEELGGAWGGTKRKEREKPAGDGRERVRLCEHSLFVFLSEPTPLCRSCVQIARAATVFNKQKPFLSAILPAQHHLLSREQL